MSATRPVSRSFRHLALLAVSAASLSGCSAVALQSIELPAWMKPAEKEAPATGNLISQSSPDCPRVSAMTELARVTQFADDTNTDSKTILSETVLTKLDTSCIVTENAINLDIMLNFMSNLGAAGLRQAQVEASYTHPYFIAVVSPQGKIIAKDVFALAPVFSSGQKQVVSSERLQQTIPLTDTAVAPGQYQVMIGFQLSEAELNYNRSLTPLPAEEVKPLVSEPVKAEVKSGTLQPAKTRSAINQ